MATFRRITFLYFCSLLAFVIIGKLFGGQIFLMLKSVGLWILPLFIIAIGQIIGFVVYVAFQKPLLKQKVFNVSYLIAFICFTGIIFYFKYSSWRHEKDFGNIEANQDHFKYWDGPYKTEEKIAFDSLSKLLVNPNSFKLTGSKVHGIDTVLNGYKQTIFLTTLIYEKENQEQTLKAKFLVISNTAHLIYFDRPLNQADNRRLDSLGKVVKKTFNESIKFLPDSIKKDISDIIDE